MRETDLAPASSFYKHYIYIKTLWLHITFPLLTYFDVSGDGKQALYAYNGGLISFKLLVLVCTPVLGECIGIC